MLRILLLMVSPITVGTIVGCVWEKPQIGFYGLITTIVIISVSIIIAPIWDFFKKKEPEKVIN